MSISLDEKIYKFLKLNKGQYFPAIEIASWICQEYPRDCLKKKENSVNNKKPLKTDIDVAQQYAAEISSRYKRLLENYPKIRVTGGSPRKYYIHSEEVNIQQEIKNPLLQREEKMYPYLIKFIWDKFNVYCKIISAGKSGNNKGKNGNKWLHPDIVGMGELIYHCSDTLQKFIKSSSDKLSKLWSFEVKKEITMSNVRSCFFQTVSNSSWANFGYLVACNIDEDALAELSILCERHGIGYINLSTDSHVDSQILIPAKENTSIDWKIVNRLSSEKNSGFNDYINELYQLQATGTVNLPKWDEYKYINSKLKCDDKRRINL
ncbi:MAG: HrgA protein [Legionellales bacterium]|nr:HrgA protein [Legionellales bacterium]